MEGGGNNTSLASLDTDARGHARRRRPRRHIPVALLVEAAAALGAVLLVPLRLVQAVGRALAQLRVLEEAGSVGFGPGRPPSVRERCTRGTDALRTVFLTGRNSPFSPRQKGGTDFMSQDS